MIFFSEEGHGARTCQAGGGVDAGGQLGGHEEGQGRGVQVGNLPAGASAQIFAGFVHICATCCREVRDGQRLLCNRLHNELAVHKQIKMMIRNIFLRSKDQKYFVEEQISKIFFEEQRPEIHFRNKDQKYFLRGKDQKYVFEEQRAEIFFEDQRSKIFRQGAQRVQDAARGRAAASGGKTARAAGEEGASA